MKLRGRPHDENRQIVAIQTRAELTRSRKPSLKGREEEDPASSFNPEDIEITAEDLPALAAKDELRNLGYMPDQSPLFGKAVPTVRLSINAYSDI